MSEPTAKDEADAEQAFATRAIHAGQSPDPTTGAIMPPIYATSTFVQQSPGVHKGFDYGRSHNPTRFALERCVADLEGGAQAFAFASGLAAIATVLELLDAGAHIVSGDDVYGGTFRLFERVRKASAGHRFSFVDLTDPARLQAALTPDTKLVWVETPTNPLLKLADLRAIAEICRARGILCAADNTFASPWVQRPLELGFDIVVHSTTKYLNGHSDVIGGIAVVGGGDGCAAARAARLPAERGRRDRRPVRQLPRAARREDAGAAHGAALRQRARAGALAGEAAAGEAGPLPGPRLASAARSWRAGRCTASAG